MVRPTCERQTSVGSVGAGEDALRSLERVGMLPEVAPLARARSPTFEDEAVPMWD
jgi:hypothetical protein